MKKIVKRTISIVLTMLLMFSIIPMGTVDVLAASTVSDLGLELGTEDGITRAEWLHNLVVVFNMTIEDHSLPDNYFSDLTEEHQYYSDILLASEFGVLNIEAGNELHPDEFVTRDFAASTLNFCLGYQLGEDYEYTYTDSDICSDPVSAQIALDREWFDLIDGCFTPGTLITSSEAEFMLNDALEVLERQIIDENHKNEYDFASDVIVIPDGTQVKEGDDGRVYITDCPESLLVGDNFAVYFNGIPCFYNVVGVSFEDNVTVVDVKTLEVDEGLKDIDAQGVIDAEDMEIIPYEGVDVTVDEEADFSTFSIKKVSNILSSATVNFGGITGKVFVKIKNPYIDYYVQSGRAYAALCGETEVVYNVSASTSAIGMSKGFSLYKCVIPGIGSFDITINVDFSGTASGVVTGWLVAGVECAKGEGVRAVKSFTQKECYTNVEAQARVSLKASLSVSQMPVLKASVYAEAGIRVNFSKKTFQEGTPKTCTHFAAYLFAEFGASASAKFGFWSTSESVSYTIFNESNSPVRIVNHYEDGQLVAKCTRGTVYPSYYTKSSSRWSGCGWLGANGTHALNVDGTYFPLYNYELNENNEATITQYNGNSWSVYIPKEIDGYKVVAIGDSAFQYKNVGYVNIPDTVTSINHGAFACCSCLRDVNIPDSVTVIDSSAFENCVALEKVTLPKNLITLNGNAFANCSSLKEINIPKTIEEINPSGYDFYNEYYGPFAYCENLKTVAFAEGIKTLPYCLFATCTGIEEITIPDTVTSIDGMVFYNCEKLKTVHIPDSVTVIESSAFKNCVALENVILPKNLITLNGNAFANCISLKEINIPKTIEEINPSGYDFYNEYYGPFAYCENLKTVTFTEGIKTLPYCLFATCTGIEEITIPDTVTSIDGRVFYNCEKLKTVHIPDSVTVIESSAFENCVALEKVTLPKNLITLNGNAFANCSSLKEINIPKTIEEINPSGYDFYNEYYGPFAYCENLKTVTFTEGIKTLPYCLFATCTGIEEITIPDTVTSIDGRVFYNCEKLKTVNIPDSVTKIEIALFANCINLQDITIPDTVTTIDDIAFQNCQALKSIVIPNSVTEMGETCFVQCSSLESVKLPNKCKFIANGTFGNCTSLKTVDVPAAVEVIESDAFYGCASLESFTFSEESKIKEIYIDAFSGCSSLKEVNLPETVNKISDNAFQNCIALEKVNIPKNVDYLGTQVFMGCEALETVDFADYSIERIESEAFKDCHALKKVVLPKGLVEVESQAFMNGTGLTEVVVPESVTFIDSTAFSYPEKTTIYGKAGSYAETFANEGGFKFVNNNVPIEGFILKDGVENITLDVGETYRAEFELFPEDANEVIALTSDNNNVSISGHNIYARYDGDAVITATTSGGLTYEFNIHIRDVNNIVITKQPTKVSYIIGENLDLNGMEVQVNYYDDSSKTITDYTVTGFDSSVEGTSTVTVQWIAADGWEYTTTFDVEIFDPSSKVKEIFIETLPTKTQYELREKLDLTGMVIKAKLTDGSEKIVSDYTTSGFNALKNGAQVITVSYNGFSTTFTIYVGIVPCDHSYGNWITDIEPTCTVVGSKHRTCSVCGNVVTEEIPATGHTAVTDKAVAATCTKAGKTAGSHCSVCNAVIKAQTTVPAKGHTAVTDKAVAATCTKAGKTAGSHCSVCNAVIKAQTIVAAKGHTLGNWITDASTRTKYKVCSVCEAKVDTQKIPLGKPTVSKIAISGNAIKLTWGKVTYADGYYVYRKASGETSWKKLATVKGNATVTYTDKAVTSGKTYNYMVKAYDGSDVSGASTTVKMLYVSTPKLSKIENTSSGVKVTWAKVTGATSYNVYRKVKGASSWTYLANTKNASYTDKTAKSGTTYYYTVRAKTASSVGAYNTTGLGIKYLAIPKLSKVENVSKAVKITWTKVAGAEGYYVYRKAPGETAWKKIATVKGNAKVTYKDTKVSNNKVYTYSVKAYSGSTASYYASGLKLVYLAVPSLTKVTSTTSGVKFTWGKVAGAEGYYVYRKTGSGSWKKIATVKGKVSYVDKSAKKGTTYYYTVKAFKGSTSSAYNTTGLKVKNKY